MLALETERQRIGEGVKRQRESLGWSKEELAFRAGLSHVTIYKIERGANTTYDTLAKIADALDISVAKLVE